MIAQDTMVNRWLHRTRRIGVAIGSDAMYVAVVDNGNSRSKSFAPWSTRFSQNLLDLSADPGEEIRRALASCPHLSGEPAALHVTLLPPLALGRGIRLPRLGADEYRRVLTRDVSRYFPVGHVAQVVGALPPRRQRSSPVPVFAVSAPSRIIDAIRAAVAGTGCGLASLECAYSSWTGAAGRISPSFSRSDAALIVCNDCVIEVIHCERGRPVSVRRVSASTPGDEILNAVGLHSKAGPPRVCAVFGSPQEQSSLREALSARGIAVIPPTPSSASMPSVLSATFAASGTGPGLYPERTYEQARAKSRRLTRLLAGIAAIALVLAAALFLWGAKRDLRAAIDQRAAIRSDVTQAIGFRDQIASLTSRSAHITSLQAATPHWSAVLSSIADALPRDASFTKFRAEADTVVLEGIASRAASVFEAMRGIPDITAIRSTAPVRQQLQDGTPVEHFTVAARLARLGPAKRDRR